MHSAGRILPHEGTTAAGGSKSSGEAASPEPSDKPSPELSPGKILIDSLADQPVRRHRINDSALVAPICTYPDPNETLRSKRKHLKTSVRQERLETWRRLHGKRMPDWRMILAHLAATPPPSTQAIDGDSVRLLVPNDAVRCMLNGTDSEITSAVERAGFTCTLNPAHHADGRSWLVLSGPGDTIDRLAKQVMRIINRITSIRDDGDTGKNGSSNSSRADAMDIEGVRDEKAVVPPVASSELPMTDGGPSPSSQQQQMVFRKYNLAKKTDELEKPRKWTRYSFETYIAALTSSRPRLHLSAHLHGRAPSHQQTIIDLLHQAFNDEEAKAAITPSAFYTALEYMSRRIGYGLGPDVRALFARVDTIHLPIGVGAFNILLRRASHNGDLGGFSSALRLMDRRGVAPDRYAWIYFLRMFESEIVRRHILKAMVAKGLLGDELAARQVAREMIAFDTERWVAEAVAEAPDSATAGLDGFWAAQKARYGDKWLSTTAGNGMVEILGRYGLFAACSEVVDRMFDHAHAQPDIATINTMLTHCKEHRTLDRSIAAVRRIDDLWYLRPDQTTYHELFETAFDVGAAYVLGVVWRYASLAGLTSRRMRRRVTEILNGQHDSYRARRAYRGLVVDPDSRAEMLRLLPEGESPSAPSFHGGAATRWYALRYKDYEPAEPLGIVMQRAYEHDRRSFTAQMAGEPLPSVELLVPLRLKKAT